MAGSIQFTGLKEFRTELEKLDGNWTAEMSLAHQKIASLGASVSRAQARGGTKLQRKAASAIGERHTSHSAQIAVLPSSVDRMANAAFYGAKRHTGWYAAHKYHESKGHQFPKWVGASWDVAVAGEGPYAINPALAQHLTQLLDEYLDMIDRLAKRAFPEGRPA